MPGVPAPVVILGTLLAVGHTVLPVSLILLEHFLNFTWKPGSLDAAKHGAIARRPPKVAPVVCSVQTPDFLMIMKNIVIMMMIVMMVFHVMVFHPLLQKSPSTAGESSAAGEFSTAGEFSAAATRITAVVINIRHVCILLKLRSYKCWYIS